MINDFLVYQDTREQRPWRFTKGQRCLGTEVMKLDTGDYTLKGLEKEFVIERKGAVSEFVKNLFDDTFWRELDRLAKFPHAYLLLEFPFEYLDFFPKFSGIPSFKYKSIKLRGPTIIKKYHEMRLAYPSLRVDFVGPSAGKTYALSLFKRITDFYDRT